MEVNFQKILADKTRVILDKNLQTNINNSNLITVTINNKCQYLLDRIEKDLLKIIQVLLLKYKFLISGQANLIYPRTKFWLRKIKIIKIKLYQVKILQIQIFKIFKISFGIVTIITKTMVLYLIINLVTGKQKTR